MISFFYNHPVMLQNAHRTMKCPLCGGALITSKEAGMAVSPLEITEDGQIVLVHTRCLKMQNDPTEGDAV